MYFEQALKRLNKIDWKNIGKERWAHENDDSLYGFEFLTKTSHTPNGLRTLKNQYFS